MIIPQNPLASSFSPESEPRYQKHLTRNLWRTEQSQALTAAFKSTNQTLGAICLELLHYGELTYSRNEHKYLPVRYHSPLSKLRAVTDAVDHLERYKAINHDRKPPGTRNRERQSSFKATDEFFDFVGAVKDGWRRPYIEPVNAELIVLRDAQKTDIDYTDSREIQRKRKRLQAYNEAVSACTPYAGCTRIYNESWSKGGRFYGSWQTLPKNDRQQLNIGGQITVELDFSAIHPSMLYTMAGLDIPKDIYTVEGVERGKVKLAFLILINATGRKSATYALAHKLQKADSLTTSYDDLMDAVEGHTGTLNDCYLSEAQRIIEAVKTRHRPIARYFHSGVGIRLQNADSSIADRVLHKLLKQGIVSLPVHDSFIVQTCHEEALRDAMDDATNKVIGVSLPIDFAVPKQA